MGWGWQDRRGSGLVDHGQPHPELEEHPAAVEADLNAFLDKAYENLPLAEVLAAPVSALQGVSDSDAQSLHDAFTIKTVADLGRNTYFRAAQLLTQLAEAGAK